MIHIEKSIGSAIFTFTAYHALKSTNNKQLREEVISALRMKKLSWHESLAFHAIPDPFIYFARYERSPQYFNGIAMLIILIVSSLPIAPV